MKIRMAVTHVIDSTCLHNKVGQDSNSLAFHLLIGCVRNVDDLGPR